MRRTGLRGLTRLLALTLLLAAVACQAGAPAGREFDLRGQVLDVDRPRATALIRHEDIPGFMPAMTMPFRVKDARMLDNCQRGDLVLARLVVTDTDAWLSRLERVGHGDVLGPVPEAPEPLLAPGAEVPDIELVAADGRPFAFSSLRGKAVALTFIYTRCPLPQFCPLMDRQFEEVRRRVQADPRLQQGAVLLSISFDPEYDTPAVLTAHARLVGADGTAWRFATAPRATLDPFARQFGLVVMRDGSAAFTHNLRTAVVDRQGRLVRVFGGNDWTPAELVDALGRLAERVR